MSDPMFDAVQKACDATVDALAACRTVESDDLAQERLDRFDDELYAQMRRASDLLFDALESLNFVAVNVE